jgi:hypothetical protein
MGIPILAPSLTLLSKLHTSNGFLSHKCPGNVPWRSTAKQQMKSPLSRDARLWRTTESSSPDAPCCANDPNDACTVSAVSKWLQFADWYTWPHILYFETPADLLLQTNRLLSNSTLRNDLSKRQKAFFESELVRTKGHVLSALHIALSHSKAART